MSIPCGINPMGCVFPRFISIASAPVDVLLQLGSLPVTHKSDLEVYYRFYWEKEDDSAAHGRWPYLWTLGPASKGRNMCYEDKNKRPVGFVVENNTSQYDAIRISAPTKGMHTITTTGDAIVIDSTTYKTPGTTYDRPTLATLRMAHNGIRLAEFYILYKGKPVVHLLPAFYNNNEVIWDKVSRSAVAIVS